MNDVLIEKLLGIEDAQFTEVENAVNPPPKPPFTVRCWGDVHNLKLPERETFLGDCFALATISSIMGQGGVGKSRISLNIARNNVLGIPFCGLATGARPLKWLFIGNENSVHRWQRDIIAMSAGLDAEQMQLLSDHIFVHCLETPEDSFICLSDDGIKMKWQQTVLAIMPDVLVGDPWGEIQFGDPNNDLDTRQSLREVVRICTHVKPLMGVVILHHARTGRQNIIQAAGWDKGNFGKGSKALYSGARSVVNLAPADPEDHTRLVMVCAKSNDAPPFDTIGIRLVEESMTYEIDPTFDLQAWQDDVEGKRSTSAKGSIQDAVDAVAGGADSYKAVISALMEGANMKERTAEKWLSEAIKKGYIRKRKNGAYVLSGKAKPRVPVQDVDSEGDI